VLIERVRVVEIVILTKMTRLWGYGQREALSIKSTSLSDQVKGCLWTRSSSSRSRLALLSAAQPSARQRRDALGECAYDEAIPTAPMSETLQLLTESAGALQIAAPFRDARED
jgi:hypothetical protein